MPVVAPTLSSRPLAGLSVDAEQYDREAALCERLAADAPSATLRDGFFNLAAQWRRLAQEARLRRQPPADQDR